MHISVSSVFRIAKWSSRNMTHSLDLGRHQSAVNDPSCRILYSLFLTSGCGAFWVAAGLSLPTYAWYLSWGAKPPGWLLHAPIFVKQQGKMLGTTHCQSPISGGWHGDCHVPWPVGLWKGCGCFNMRKSRWRHHVWGTGANVRSKWLCPPFSKLLSWQSRI